MGDEDVEATPTHETEPAGDAAAVSQVAADPPTGADEGASSKASRRAVARRRRANVAGGRQHSHRVLVTPEEELRLLRLAAAQGVTVPRLLVESALAGDRETPSQRRAAMAELFAVRRLVSGIAVNVNQLARQANATHEVPAEAAATVTAARRVVERVLVAVEGLSRP